MLRYVTSYSFHTTNCLSHINTNELAFAVRALMRYDTKPISDYDLSSLRVLGSVGEPINPEAWKWYDENVGKGKCSVVDTYWQTETGAHIAANLPGKPSVPSHATLL
jgi:acetyl-CoA synthetase